MERAYLVVESSAYPQPPENVQVERANRAGEETKETEEGGIMSNGNDKMILWYLAMFGMGILVVALSIMIFMWTKDSPGGPQPMIACGVGSGIALVLFGWWNAYQRAKRIPLSDEDTDRLFQEEVVPRSETEMKPEQ